MKKRTGETANDTSAVVMENDWTSIRYSSLVGCATVTGARGWARPVVVTGRILVKCSTMVVCVILSNSEGERARQ